MEAKKNNRADLEGKRSLFFQAGLLIALGFTLVAFEWQFADEQVGSEQGTETVNFGWDIEISRTYPDEPPPPAPPQPSFDLEIVDDDVYIEDGIVFSSSDLGENIIKIDVFVPKVIEEYPEPDIVDVGLVETAPLFNGKPVDEGFRVYIGDNMVYPSVALEHGIFGKVFIQFVVDRYGNISEAKVIRSADPLLDNEALRLIKSTSGMWTPGKQRNKPVNVRYTFPIAFKMQ
jgi:protein TonB